MDKMNRINLLFTLDANYLPRLHVVLTSICLNNQDEDFCVYLMHRSLSRSELNEIARRCDAYGWKFFVGSGG